MRCGLGYHNRVLADVCSNHNVQSSQVFTLFILSWFYDAFYDFVTTTLVNMRGSKIRKEGQSGTPLVEGKIRAE